MKKKIYLILTLILSLFIFSGRVEAAKELIDGKWNAKCSYCGETGGCFYISFNENEFVTEVNRDKISSSINSFDIEELRLYIDKGCPEYIYEYYLETETAGEQILNFIFGGDKTFVAKYSFWEPQIGFKPNFMYSQCNPDDLTGISCTYTMHHLNVIPMDKNNSDWVIYEEEPIVDVEKCDDLLGSELIDKINDVMNIVRIAVPILLLILGVVDFTKAIFGTKEEDMSKSRKTFFNRIIAAVIVFFVPVFVNLILSIANQVWDVINPNTCIK